VNQSFARRLALGENPIGKRFHREATPSEPETTFEVVGLVKDTKYFSLREEFMPIAFLSIAQHPRPDSGAQVLIRSAAPLTDLTLRIRNLAAEIHPAMTVDFRKFDTTVQEGLLRERLMATLSGFFGFLAALIAAVGLYGVMSYLVVRRTNEIGIRMALGADGRDVLALIMRQAGTLLAIGLAAGTLMALAAAQAARSMLFGLKPYDAATLGIAGAILAAVTVVASYVPARRAARLEPVTALREE
jgi:ABC-type antimicrobial peptide transport system permease subunit